jgi:putative transposase
MFADGIRRQRVSRMRGFRHWRWHLDEMYVKLNGEMSPLASGRSGGRDPRELHHQYPRQEGSLTFMKKAMKRHGSPAASPLMAFAPTVPQ